MFHANLGNRKPNNQASNLVEREKNYNLSPESDILRKITSILSIKEMSGRATSWERKLWSDKKNFLTTASSTRNRQQRTLFLWNDRFDFYHDEWNHLQQSKTKNNISWKIDYCKQNWKAIVHFWAFKTL